MKIILWLAVFFICSGSSHTAFAVSAGTNGLSSAFSKDSTSVGIVAGSGTAFNDNYTILGVGAGYYLAEGLELGLDVQYWFSGKPSITKVSPKITYVFTQLKVFKPYLGVFYRRTIYGDYNGIKIDDTNSYGYRVGAYFNTNNSVSIGGGIVYEKFTDCNAVYSCSSTYPELTFTVTF